MAEEVGQFICGHPRTAENSRRQGAGYACKECRGAPPCAVDGCGQKHSARGYCHQHYNQAVREGAIPSSTLAQCAAFGCGLRVRARGMCSTHYQRERSGRGRVTQDNRGKACAVESCGVLAVTRGRCLPHHQARKAIERYGLSEAAYEDMVARQGGRCAVCGATSPGANYSRWSIDHDHGCCPGAASCGRCVRGLLCRNCNVGIGHFDDDPDRLLAAAAYLLSRTDLLKGLGSVRTVTSVG